VTLSASYIVTPVGGDQWVFMSLYLSFT